MERGKADATRRSVGHGPGLIPDPGIAAEPYRRILGVVGVRPLQAKGGADVAQMTEGLGKVAELRAGRGVDLLANKPAIVCEAFHSTRTRRVSVGRLSVAQRPAIR